MDTENFILAMKSQGIHNAKAITTKFALVILDLDYQHLLALKAAMGNEALGYFDNPKAAIHVTLSLTHHLFEKYCHDESISSKNLLDALYASFLIAIKVIFLDTEHAPKDKKIAYVSYNQSCAKVLDIPLPALNKMEFKFYCDMKGCLNLLEWTNTHWPSQEAIIPAPVKITAEHLMAKELAAKTFRSSFDALSLKCDKAYRTKLILNQQREISRSLKQYYALINRLKTNKKATEASALNNLTNHFLDIANHYFSVQLARATTGEMIDSALAKAFKPVCSMFFAQAEAMQVKSLEALKPKQLHTEMTFIGAGRAF
jgi:hypothetical protein